MASKAEPLHLLRVKFYRPRATGDLIRRARVREILNRHLDRALTLVCAPAGFGKTVLVSDWLESCPWPNAWLWLDKGDSDLSVFLSYVLAAIRGHFPSTCKDTLALLQAPVLPPPGVLLTTLANDLDGLADAPALAAGQRFVLVLDDYHLVQGQAVHALLGELLQHPPRTMHLILLTRQDPPFPIHSLRARGELGEVRTQELRFTHEEVALFMEQALGLTLDPVLVTTLAERTEGWATGLRLAALSLSTGGSVEGPELAVDDRFVLDYLMNEVLAHVPVATEDFLLRTSILDRLCGPLCDAVAGPTGLEWDGRAYLEWLAAENLFTFALDAEGTWYRYHLLFQKLLRSRLERRYDSHEIAELHARASAWFVRSGFIDEAIEHALAGGDENAAVQLVEVHRHEAMNREHWRQLERWLSLMPRQLVETRLELSMLEAWTLERQWRFADIPSYLDRFERLMAQTMLPEADRVRLHGEFDALRALTCYYIQDVEGTRSHSERALQSTPFSCSFARASAWFYYAAARQMTGDMPGTLDAFHEALNEDRLHGNAFPSRLYAGLCLAHWMNADLPNLMRVANQLLQLAWQRDLAEATGFAHYFRGCVLYQLNDLAGAEKEFGAVVQQRYLAHAFAFSQSVFGQASVFRAQGATDQARKMVESLAVYALEMNNTRISTDVEAFRARLAWEIGSAAEAQRWAETKTFESLFGPITTFHVALMSQCRVLVDAGTPAGLARAGQTLARLHELLTRTHNTRFLIEVLALQALLYDALGDRNSSLRCLEQSVSLAEPGGMIRVFVDLGARAAVLLRQLPRDVAPYYLPRVLAAFGEEPGNGRLPAPPGVPLPARAELGETLADLPSLIEPLSDRELEVLVLLAERLSNKEIARELDISPMTVKRHTVNIYQKLSVGSRRDAVARAYALGLLPPSLPARRRP